MATPNLKPFQLYSAAESGAPNPYKVMFVLEELGLPYEIVDTPYDTLKVEPYISVNPNGRLPSLVDGNRDNITLWESGAIIDYLIAEYDPDKKLHYDTFPERYITRCWEHFQMSGQGPYFGQLGWFMFWHPERVPSAIERYVNEIKRVTGVIDAHLTKTGTPYLVGDRVTYADIMMVPYYIGVANMWREQVDLSEYLAHSAWMQRLLKRPAMARVAERLEKQLVAGAKAREELAAAQKK